MGYFCLVFSTSSFIRLFPNPPPLSFALISSLACAFLGVSSLLCSPAPTHEEEEDVRPLRAGSERARERERGREAGMSFFIFPCYLDQLANQPPLSGRRKEEGKKEAALHAFVRPSVLLPSERRPETPCSLPRLLAPSCCQQSSRTSPEEEQKRQVISCALALVFHQEDF